MTTIQAERKTIRLAGKDIDVFLMPDGSYQYSTTSAAKSIGKERADFQNFKRKLLSAEPLHSKVLRHANILEGYPSEGSPSKGLDSANYIDSNTRLVKVGRTRVSVVPQEIVVQYWMWKASNGSVEPLALLGACAMEALDRRSDSVYGLCKTEQQYEQQSEAFRRTLALSHELLQPYSKEHEDKTYREFCQGLDELTEEEIAELNSRNNLSNTPHYEYDRVYTNRITICSGYKGNIPAHVEYIYDRGTVWYRDEWLAI